MPQELLFAAFVNDKCFYLQLYKFGLAYKALGLGIYYSHKISSWHQIANIGLPLGLRRSNLFDNKTGIVAYGNAVRTISVCFIQQIQVNNTCCRVRIKAYRAGVAVAGDRNFRW